jgi:predicted DNA-binding transcriptional regulator YafY
VKYSFIVVIILGMSLMQAAKINSGSLVPDAISMGHAVKVIYTNWRGETAERIIVPVSISWGKTEWHPEEQWLLKVWDVERQAYRDYALKDIKEWCPN